MKKLQGQLANKVYQIQFRGLSWHQSLVCVLQGISAVLCLILFVLSISQLSSNEITETGEQIWDTARACTSNKELLDYRPLCFHFTEGEDTTTEFKCPWATKNSIFRMNVIGIHISLIVLGIWAIIKHVKIACWVNVFGGSVCVLLLIVVTGLDAHDVQQSEAWCNEGMVGVVWNDNPNPSLECSYGQYIFTVLWDLILLLFWSLTILFTFWLVNNHWENYSTSKEVQPLCESGYNDEEEGRQPRRFSFLPKERYQAPVAMSQNAPIKPALISSSVPNNGQHTKTKRVTWADGIGESTRKTKYQSFGHHFHALPKKEEESEFGSVKYTDTL